MKRCVSLALVLWVGTSSSRGMEVDISPKVPSSSDEVSVTVSVRLPEGMVLDHVCHTIKGYDVLVDMYWGGFGMDWAPLVEFTHTEVLGRLAPGRYAVYVKCQGSVISNKKMASFTVLRSASDLTWDWVGGNDVMQDFLQAAMERLHSRWPSSWSGWPFSSFDWAQR